MRVSGIGQHRLSGGLSAPQRAGQGCGGQHLERAGLRGGLIGRRVTVPVHERRRHPVGINVLALAGHAV
ncbi:MAG: hypothetical protein C4290_12180 [Chloroflexota bacterium]